MKPLDEFYYDLKKNHLKTSLEKIWIYIREVVKRYNIFDTDNIFGMDMYSAEWNGRKETVDRIIELITEGKE